MALARLITRTPELAQTLAQSLIQAGYEVEFASPDLTPVGPADLEVDLDDPSAATSYIVSSDGTEISFIYDPVEREFVLAPVWRRARQLFMPVTRAFNKVRTARERKATSVNVNLDAEVVAAPPVPKIDPPQPEATLSTTPPPVFPLPDPVSHSLYLSDATPIPMAADSEPPPAPIHFSGIDLFDGHGVRKTPNHADVVSPAEFAPLLHAQEAASEEVTAKAAAEPLSRIWHSWETRVSALVDAKRRWNALGSAASSIAVSHWLRLKTYRPKTRLRQYDLAWMRAVPVAALLALAFLLGWSVSRSGSPAPQPAAAPVEVNEAAVIPVESAAPAPKLKATSTKPSPKKSTVPVEKNAANEADFTAEDVVIRHYPKHYPAKEVRADNERPTVRRYSDIE